jgi:hypothetical protein
VTVDAASVVGRGTFATSLGSGVHCKGAHMQNQRPTTPQSWAQRERRRQIAGMIIVVIVLAAVVYTWHHFYGGIA